MPWGPRWTKTEIFRLRSLYSRLGARRTAEVLARAGFPRTPAAVQCRAKQLGLFVCPGGRRSNLVLLSDAHARVLGSATRHAHPRILAEAERDGVLVRGEVHPHPYLAPEWWVDTYVARLAEEEAEQAQIARTWATTDVVARWFDVPPQSLRTVIRRDHAKKGLLKRHAREIERRKIVVPQESDGRLITPTLFWQPDQATAAAVRYREERSRSPWHRARA